MTLFSGSSYIVNAILFEDCRALDLQTKRVELARTDTYKNLLPNSDSKCVSLLSKFPSITLRSSPLKGDFTSGLSMRPFAPTVRGNATDDGRRR
jgi:hypothetical protein